MGSRGVVVRKLNTCSIVKLPQGGLRDLRKELIGTAGRWLKDREVVEAVAAYWDAVGIKSKVRIFEFNEYLNRLFDRKTRGDAIFVVSSNELLDADKSFSAYYRAGGIGSSRTIPRFRRRGWPSCAGSVSSWPTASGCSGSKRRSACEGPVRGGPSWREGSA